MRIRNGRLAAGLLGGMLAAVVVSQAVAAPKKVVPTLSDSYGGEATSARVTDPETQEPVTGAIELTISSVKNRRFGGTVTFGALQDVPIQGTLSASGQINIQTKARGGAKLTLKGKFTDAVVEPPALKKIQGTYQFSKGGDRGTFLVEDLTP